jgi:hypothetical protein
MCDLGALAEKKRDRKEETFLNVNKNVFPKQFSPSRIVENVQSQRAFS